MIDRAVQRIRKSTFEELQRQEQVLIGEIDNYTNGEAYQVPQLTEVRAELERRRVVRAGVAVFLFDHHQNDRFLLMKRSGSHGAGTWGLPGGHIEYGESATDAAAREINEELGLPISDSDISVIGVSEAVFSVEHKHYVTVLCRAALAIGQYPRIMEPEKCEELRWAGGLIELPDPLFSPLGNYIAKWGIPTQEHPRGR